jgi:hypothetical protein
MRSIIQDKNVVGADQGDLLAVACVGFGEVNPGRMLACAGGQAEDEQGGEENGDCQGNCNLGGDVVAG